MYRHSQKNAVLTDQAKPSSSTVIVRDAAFMFAFTLSVLVLLIWSNSHVFHMHKSLDSEHLSSVEKIIELGDQTMSFELATYQSDIEKYLSPQNIENLRTADHHHTSMTNLAKSLKQKMAHQSLRQNTMIIIGIGTLITLLPVSIILWIKLLFFLKRHISENEKLLHIIEDNNANLKTQIKEKTKQFTDVNTALQLEISRRELAADEADSLKRLVETSSQGFIICDLNYQITYANRKFALLVGEERYDEPIGKSVLSYYSEAMQKQLTDKILPTVFKSERIEHESTIHSVLGHDIPTWENILIICDNKGQAIHYAFIITDITERKEVEAKQHQLLLDLATANKDLKNMQSQIIQNEKLASIGQLAAGVAHEINTPVGFVASNFQTLQKYLEKFQQIFDLFSHFLKDVDNLDKGQISDQCKAINQLYDDSHMDMILEDIEPLFEDSKEGLDRITNIVQNLRDFSHIDQAADITEYDINKGLSSTLVVAKNELKYNAQVETDFGQDIPTIKCNSGQINQVFLNILVNASQAIKFQEENDHSGVIGIKTYSDDEYVVCQITDNGPGINPDSLTKIFDPFFTTKPVGKGTGLGLSVSYDIIATKHKGIITAENRLGKGAKFTIKLPIVCQIETNKDDDNNESNINEPNELETIEQLN